MHKQFILAALDQAWLGRGICAPNPSVGAVAVRDNTIIARAWHQGAGTAHAEQRILEQLPAGITGITLYVTLEPCNHFGKTPPCVLSIIDYGIERVVYGFSDPNPVVIANNTPHILKQHGIDVIYFPLAEINTFYQSYYYWTKTSKPWVTAKLAHTLDGKIAANQGEKIQLSNELCADFTHLQRLRTDVILTTARTIINDDPAFNVRLKATKQKKVIAIIDTRLSLPMNATIHTTAAHCHIYHDENLSVQAPQPNCSYHPLPTKEGHLDLLGVIEHLGELGYHDAWVEAGGLLFSALHEQSLVQTTYLYIVPDLLGADATPGFYGKTMFHHAHTLSWQAQGNNMIACLQWKEGVCLPD